MKKDESLDINTKMSGQYKLVVKHSDGTIDETHWMDNIILDTGLNKLGYNVTLVQTVLLQHLQVGTGSAAPVAAQTRLQTYLASTSLTSFSNLYKGAPLYESEQTYAYTFAQGAVVGNITEVGTCSTDGNTSDLFSRTLIVDAQGVPTAFTVVALDSLTVYYKLTLYPTITDSTGSFVINGITYNYTSRAASVQSIGSEQLKSYPFGYMRSVYTAVQASNMILKPLENTIEYREFFNIDYYPDGFSISTDPYVNGSYQAKGTVTLGINKSNFLIGAIQVAFGNAHTQFLITPPIPKTNTNELKLKFSYSWGRG